MLELKDLKTQIRRDLKTSECYRDLVVNVCDNFSVDILIEYLLTHRVNVKELIIKAL